MSKQIKVYYAHPMSIYDTPQELRDIRLLESMYLKVLNPNTPEHAAAGKGKMDYYCELALSCDMIAFRALPDGMIGSGVSKEIEVCQLAEMPVLELPTAISRRKLTLEQTVEALQQSGER